MSNRFTEHDHKNKCKDYLPKASRKNYKLLTQCSYCGRLYICSGYGGYGYFGYCWEETEIRSGKLGGK